MFTPQELPGRYGRVVQAIDHLLKLAAGRGRDESDVIELMRANFFAAANTFAPFHLTWPSKDAGPSTITSRFIASTTARRSSFTRSVWRNAYRRLTSRSFPVTDR